ncbi:unnamed protein product [Pleuronectes platessa]|uniref:Uncharacterized protein n=1 Tax=Pleuronectes platessa TaxID=8262 RepID=A0A9N7UEM5_PLEPL|nr:unnamed protein product [Pleuronectes platessa]
MSVILNPPILSRSHAEGQEVNRDRNNGPAQTQQTMARGSSLPMGCIISNHRSIYASFPSLSPPLPSLHRRLFLSLHRSDSPPPEGFKFKSRFGLVFAFVPVSVWQPNPAGKQRQDGKKKGANESGRWDGMGARRGDTDGVGGGSFVHEESDIMAL